jgi:UDPglucose 6-dehydrogenase
MIVGAGIVGMATGRGLLRLGHDVTFYDIDPERRRDLFGQGYRVSESINPSEYFQRDYPLDIIFICTPESAVEDVIHAMEGPRDSLGRRSRRRRSLDESLIVIRSTVPPGMTKRLQSNAWHICHNPEFLREAVADYEFMNPHLVIIGECCKEHGNMLEDLYAPLRVPIIRVDSTTSEMTKLVSNAYLATQISFWNELAVLCQKLGVNSHTIGKALSLDPRISVYGSSMHGAAYGGKCLPKDLEQLISGAEAQGVDANLLKAVKTVNEKVGK